jgi:hypothetical protein
MSSQKTVFLYVTNGFSVRYMLRTDILKTLLADGARVVVLYGDADRPEFLREFSAKGVLVEKVDNQAYKTYEKKNWFAQFFKYVRRFTLSSRGDLRTIDIFMEVERLRLKSIRQLFRYYAAQPFIWLLRRSAALRKIWVKAEGCMLRPDVVGRLFEKYKPDALVVNSLGYFNYDYFVMREARKRGVRIVSVILSWDNTTSKGIGGEAADRVITWTENMRQEVVTFHDYRPEDVAVGGVAHFDAYARSDTIIPKEKFSRSLGLDPRRKTIFFATKSPSMYPWNPDITEIMAKAVSEGRIGVSCQILVRLHPSYFVKKHAVLGEEHSLQSENIEAFRRITEQYPFVVLNSPTIHKKTSFDIDASEEAVLHSILAHSDVLVNMYSTLNLEGCLMDVPTVNICFNGSTPSPTGDRRHDLTIDEMQYHNQRVVRSGAVRMARTPEELVESLNECLKDRSVDREKRLQLCRDECGPNPGSAGRNIASAIMTFMGAPISKIKSRKLGVCAGERT